MRIRTYYSYNEKSGKHVVTLQRGADSSTTFTVDTADYRASSVADFLRGLHSACAELVLDYQIFNFEEESDRDGMKRLHVAAAEIAKGFADMLVGMSMLRQTPAAAVKALYRLHNQLVNVSGMATLLSIVTDWSKDLPPMIHPFKERGFHGSVRFLPKERMQFRIGKWIAGSLGDDNAAEYNVYRNVPFDERVYEATVHELEKVG